MRFDDETILFIMLLVDNVDELYDLGYLNLREVSG